MKRAIATLLSFCMMFSIMAQGTAALADEYDAVQISAQTETRQSTDGTPEPESGATLETAQTSEEDALAAELSADTDEPAQTEEEQAEEEEPVSVPENTAGVNVVMMSALPLRQEVSFTVTLSGEKEDTQTLTLAPSQGDTPAQSRASFSDLPNGTYTLTVSGQGFATYTQTIQVQDLLYSVQLYTDFLANYIYEEDSVHPGTLRVGDVDDDGEILQSDVDALISAMGQEGGNADLDGNGAVDLVDLQLLAANLDDNRDTQATVQTTIPQSLTKAEGDGTTEVTEGSLESLLNGTESVTLKPVSQETISEDTPVTVSFDFAKASGSSVAMEGMVLQTPADSDNAVSAATILVEYEENGETKEMEVQVTDNARARGNVATVQPDGSIVVDFGGQIAVKKVTIKVTATSQSTNLAEISKVEFVNDMESRIPPPTMNIPTNLTAAAGSQTFTLTWSAEPNVTGYEVMVTQGNMSETVRTSVNTLTVTSLKGKKLTNGQTYTVKVQSVNGDWRSGYGEEITVTPKSEKVPPAPDALTLTGRFQRMEASWANMKDTNTYNVYYRKQGDAEFTKIEGVEKNSYTIQGLENNTRYEVYVTGVNELGEGPASLTSTASTANVNPVKLPAYKLINTPSGAGEVTAHIKSVTHLAGYMKDSPLDSGSSAWGVVDNDFTSWYGMNDWDDGAAYPDNGGIRVTFDGTYHIGSISLTQAEDRGYYSHVRVYAHDEGGKEYQLSGVSIVKHSDGSRSYYTIKIPGGVSTDYLRVCVGYLYDARPVSISELRFYTYDSLEDDIMALYADDLHITLREDVEKSDIDALQERLNTPDEVSGELHPEREALQRELDAAYQLLETQLNDSVQVHTTITAQKDGHVGFNGLNAWQPLGVTAYANEELIIYVGSNTLSNGANASLQLIATQYNAEYGQLASKPISLKVGRNEITIPKLVSFDAEHGGALYVQYTGNNSSDVYTVRVSGGVQTPTLNLYGIDDEAERKALATAYVEELEAYAAELESLHESLHGDTGHSYNAQECVLNTTDVMLDQMMLSVPVTQLLAGLGSGSTADKAERLLNSMDAMDQMMILFYQHKGLTNLAGAGDSNRLPSQHLNIRYMRMFAGAFMYAAGNHIGIGWDSVTGLAGGSPIVLNEDGTYQSGNYFGWGIAHEIGHNINQGSYAVAEVTNNYFAQLSQIMEGTRFGYNAIYSKVTSGTVGQSSDVFTQLGLYWQLHLAYDKGCEYQIYDNYNDLFQSRFYARVDTYARNTTVAPAPGGVKLTLGSDAEQNFMRLASAAAQKDLTDFFERWGMVPNAVTSAYMQQFEAETRAIYYGDDDSRDYRFTHSAESSFAGQNVLTEGTTAAVDEKTPNQVNLTLASNADSGLLLGYEIARVTYENGKAKTEVVGFTTENTFTDTVTTVNNRTITYQVTAVDQFLNRSRTLTLPTVKISHDGSCDKSYWTVTTNMVSDQDTTPGADDHDPCEPEPESAITQVIDNDKQTTYTGTATEGEAVITLDFHKTLAATGFKYTVTSGTPIQEYEIRYSADGSQWITLATGTFTDESVNTVYFRNENNDPWVCTYDAAQLRLIVKAPVGTEISISELDVLGPTGDNVELLENGIGILSQDYTYGQEDGQTIPAGSLIFTGSYKGNPAYNVVLLYDADGNIVGGVDEEGSIVASQIILAPDPENGRLGEVSEGCWVYWIEPDTLEQMTLPESVRVELYRVDNAMTNEGQRLTSDTLMVTLPEELPPITLESRGD